MYAVTRNRILSQNRCSEGGCLSPLLFIIFMDEIWKTAQDYMKALFIGYRNMEPIKIADFAFADDVAVIADSAHELERSLAAWNSILMSNGMKLNTEKTKVMVVSRESKAIQIKIEN